MLTLALSKGRIFKETLPLLKAAGIEPIDDPETSRKLILDTNQPDVRLIIVRASDVPSYVEFGGADIGVAGKDVLLEHPDADLYEPVDLRIACCKLMTAGRVNEEPIKGRLKVATKFVESTRRFYAGIVDVVDTGNTLRANGLVPMEHIADISSRLVVNKASMKMKHERIQQFISQIRDAVKEQHND